MQDSKVYVALHGVKNSRLLFPCQVSVALQEVLLSIFDWYLKPSSCKHIYIQRTDSKDSPSCPITYFQSYSAWSAKSIGNMYCFW